MSAIVFHLLEGLVYIFKRDRMVIKIQLESKDVCPTESSRTHVTCAYSQLSHLSGLQFSDMSDVGWTK